MEQPRGTWLEVDLTHEPIAGRLHDGDHPPRDFSGWLDLVAALEEARVRAVRSVLPGSSERASSSARTSSAGSGGP
jgi:hypothetical protein